MSDNESTMVSAEAVTGTIDHFTGLDQAGDRRTMNELARRLGKDQPALLQFAAATTGADGAPAGEAAVFYGTLVWAMFDRAFPRTVPRLLPETLTAAAALIDEEIGRLAGGEELAIHERVAPGLKERQPHIVAKLQELVEEDVRESAITAEVAAAIMRPTQVFVEAFDAALAGRLPAQSLHPVVRTEPKIGRNDPCHCGSGTKFKRCHGAA